MRFALDISRTKLPFRFTRRIGWRNSRTRLETSGYPNFERRWLLGLDVVLEWGRDVDPAKPQWSYRKEKADQAKATTSAKPAGH